MTEYSNENRGSIWKNDKKEKDTHPDFTGSLNVGGVDYWVSAWKRKEGAKATAPALSFSVKPKEEASQAKPDPISSGQVPMSQRLRRDDDADIPF
jgi:hypothetical protein